MESGIWGLDKLKGMQTCKVEGNGWEREWGLEDAGQSFYHVFAWQARGIRRRGDRKVAYSGLGVGAEAADAAV